MRKSLLFLSISVASIGTFAQTPTWNFESWTTTEPTGWISENELMVVGNPQSVFEDSVSFHGGKYAMKLLSIKMTSPVSGLPDPIGLAAPGKLVNFAPKFGTPYTGRPSSAVFWYKYSPAVNDTAEFLITLWNSVTHDTLAFGYWKTGTSIISYSSQTITLTYNPAFSTEVPDSMGLTFSSTKLFNPDFTLCMNCGTAGSTLWVDDITFSGWNGINEHPSSNDIIVYPNPATDYISIIADVNDAFSVVAYDGTGRTVASIMLNQSMAGMNRKGGIINTSSLSSGLYSYSVFNKTGTILRTGKFNVMR